MPEEPQQYSKDSGTGGVKPAPGGRNGTILHPETPHPSQVKVVNGASATANTGAGDTAARSHVRKSKRVRKQASAARVRSYSFSSNDVLEALPPLQYEKAENRENALVNKLRQCHKLCDFNDVTIDLKNKEVKRAGLNDIIDYLGQVSWSKSVVNERIYDEIISMVRANIFRDLPPCELPEFDGGADDDDPVQDLSWPHLQLVYDILLRFLENPEFDAKLGKRYITQNFIFNLIKLFDSLDSREREMLKTILHRIYGKLLGLRAYIRKEISHVFLVFAYEDESFHGIAELLEIMGSIINGFALPVKHEHVQFLHKVLMPLHRPYNMSVYHENLTVCVLQFIDKNPAQFAGPVLAGLLKLWPKTNSHKSIAFINEVDEILLRLSPAHLAPGSPSSKQGPALPPEGVIGPLTRQLAACVCSQNFQVAERALSLWNSNVFLQILQRNLNTVMPIMFPALYQASKEHWNGGVVQLVYQVLKVLMEWEPGLFDQLVDQYKLEKEASIQRTHANNYRWKLIEEQVAAISIQSEVTTVSVSEATAA